MRIQTLIFTALLFILPTIAVGATTNCPTKGSDTTLDDFKDICKNTPGCSFTETNQKCTSCTIGEYKESPGIKCQDCTNKPNAGEYIKNEDYVGMQANICPWELTCNKNTQFIQQNDSCQACQPHQYNEETYVIYNIKGVQSGSPGYTYQKINDNGTYGDQLSSAPQCKDKIMEIDWNMPYEGASLSGRLPKYYTCKSKDNKIEISFIDEDYTLVGYSIDNEKKVNADYNCTDDPTNCYNLDQICNNPDQPNDNPIYAIWRPAEYQINYYFGDKLLQEVKADFSTQQSITDIKGKISETGNQWPESADIIFDIYEVYDNGQETISSQQKIGDPIPHPSKAGNNISIKILCPAGYYCENDNNAQYAVDNYKQCPDGKTSALGSTTEADCTYKNYTTFCDLNGCMTFK